MEFNRGRYIERLSGMRWNGLVKVITGARRAGKSYLLVICFIVFCFSKVFQNALLICLMQMKILTGLKLFRRNSEDLHKKWDI